MQENLQAMIKQLVVHSLIFCWLLHQTDNSFLNLKIETDLFVVITEI